MYFFARFRAIVRKSRSCNSRHLAELSVSNYRLDFPQLTEGISFVQIIWGYNSRHLAELSVSNYRLDFPQ